MPSSKVEPIYLFTFWSSRVIAMPGPHFQNADVEIATIIYHGIIALC